jgi:putative flippase GtrA
MEDMNKETARLLRFGLTGCLNTGVDWLVFFLLASLVGLAPMWAQVLAYLTGVLNSWFLNSLWVFREEPNQAAPWKSPGPVFPRFVLVTGLSAAATSGAMQLLASTTSLPLLADKVMVTILGMAVNYLFYHNWVFAVSNQAKTKDEQ